MVYRLTLISYVIFRFARSTINQIPTQRKNKFDKTLTRIFLHLEHDKNCRNLKEKL